MLRAMEMPEGDFGLSTLQKLKSLCKMLREDADKILSGEMGITISSRTLYELNESVDNLQDGLSPPNLSLDVEDAAQSASRASELEEWNFQLQLVLDIVATAPVLVLYRGKERGPKPESSAPVSNPIRLGYFTSLSHLEISHVPIQSIQDLLKMRERLETLVVINCFSSNFRLQDVLEMCDQEVSVPMHWATLKQLCLRCNNLMELDGSLRLCPRLEMLDLSRNRLVTTDAYLGYLMELRHVDLSHNDLTVLPQFSATAKKKLQVLLLAGNKLIDLQGVEEMTSLEHLDVSENLISSHQCLRPVRSLHRLDKLNMKSCPASLRKDHKLLALQYISTVSLSRKFSLDGHLVTHREIQNSRVLLSHSQCGSSHRRHFAHTSPTPRRHLDQTDGGSHLVRNHEDAPSAADDVMVNSIPVRKKKGRKKAKARTMEISDMDTSTGGDLSSKDVTPSGTPKAPSRMEALAQLRRLELQEKRAELEQLRRYYGNSWLQAVEDQAVLPRPASTLSASNLATQSAVGANHGMSISLEVHAAHSGAGVDRSAGLQSAGGENSSGLQLTGEAEQTAESRAFDKETMFLSSGSGAEDGGTHDLPCQTTAGVPLQPAGDDVAVGEEVTLLSDDGQPVGSREDVWTQKSKGGVKNQDSQYSPDVSNSVHDSAIEPEDQSEPFIVTLANNPDDHLILAVSLRYLVEKDINGVMQDKLDLQCLETVNVEVEEAKGSQVERDVDNALDLDLKQVKVSLDFSYVRKDRRCRAYIMEDFITAQHFSELVQPFIDAKVEAAMKKQQVQYQCLRCSSEFTKAQARTTVHTDDIPRTGSSKNFKSMADLGEGKVTLHCPKCGSDHVVQLETSAEQEQVNATSFPPADVRRDSLNRKQSYDQLMLSQSPRAHSTPMKQHGSSSDVHLAASPQRKGSKSSMSKNLFGVAGQDYKEIKDGPQPSPATATRTAESRSQKQEGDSLPKGRQRSNAFYDQPPPVESRQRSNAISSTVEFLERSERSSGSVTSFSSDVERRSSASNSVTSFDPADASQLATFGVLNNLHLAVGSDSSDLTEPRAVVSSVDSDITILNKRDSGASVEILSLSLTSSAPDLFKTDFVAVLKEEPVSAETDSGGVAENSPLRNKETDENKKEMSARERILLPLTQPESDSVEVTPMGSPLSSSICSSMVSSMYHNSLVPNVSASSDSVTGSDHGMAVDGGSASGGSADVENEMSIYDQNDGTGRGRNGHKTSVSSEVEVLAVEEESSQKWEVYSSKDVSEVVAAPAADGGETTAAAVVSADSSAGEASGYDFKYLDHRQALYLMMTVFDNDEEFKFKVKCSVCQYMMSDEYEAMVIITSMKLYILRINTEDSSVELTEGMTVMEAQPHAELKRVDVGLGGQTLRLEYGSDCSSYTLVFRDQDKLDTFKELLSDQLESYARETDIPMSAVVNEAADQQTLDYLDTDVLTKGGHAESLRLYTLGYIARGHNPRYPIAFVVSSSQISLVKTNHQWPSPQHQTPVTVETNGKQFTVLERQKINNIATLELHEEIKRRLRITFFNETSGDETQWLISMESEKEVMALVDAVRQPWEEAFGVEMDVDVSAFELSF